MTLTSLPDRIHQASRRRCWRSPPRWRSSCSQPLRLALGSARRPSGGGSPPRRAPPPSADRRAPADPGRRPGRRTAYASLGNAYLQKARETGDPATTRAPRSRFSRALDATTRATPARWRAWARWRSPGTTSARAPLRAAALAAAPDVVRIYGVIVDAQVELGRYGEAERTLQRMVDLKPNLASYARVSYFRELHGDLDGALEAMRLAVSAGGDAPRTSPTCRRCSATWSSSAGALGAAERAYRTRARALSRLRAGRGRAGARRGRPRRPRRRDPRYRRVVARLPLPEYVIALGEAELAAGRARGSARVTSRSCASSSGCSQRNGVNTDTELALFEANHGIRGRAVELGRRAWAAAPSVRSADALGWALTRAGRPRRGPALGPARAAARLAGPVVPVPRGHERARRRARRTRPPLPRALARAATRASRRSTRRAPAARWRSCGEDGLCSACVALVGAGGHAGAGRARAPARQLLRQPPHRGRRSRATASRLRYILDQAEIPTFQERGLSPAEVLARKRAEVAPRARADRERARRCRCALEPARELSFPPGQGGLKTDARRAAAERAASSDPRRVELRRRHVRRPRRLEGDRRAAGRRDRGALERPRGRSDERPARLPGGARSQSPLDQRAATLRGASPAAAR